MTTADLLVRYAAAGLLVALLIGIAIGCVVDRRKARQEDE